LKSQDYITIDYPRSRLATFDVGLIGGRKHHIAGLLEVDVTAAKGMLDEAIKSGRRLSFTSWMLKAIADTVAENSFIQAINHRGLTPAAQDFILEDIAIESLYPEKDDGHSNGNQREHGRKISGMDIA
jgi:hypothetical protein